MGSREGRDGVEGIHLYQFWDGAQFERVLPAVDSLLDPGHRRSRVPINRSCAVRQRGPKRLVDRPRQHRSTGH